MDRFDQFSDKLRGLFKKQKTKRRIPDLDDLDSTTNI